MSTHGSKETKETKGSQKQIQLCVEQPDELNRAIKKQIGQSNALIEWIVPAKNGEKYKEKIGLKFLMDEKFLEVDGFDIDGDLKDFWPLRGGPHWDAVAVISGYDGDPSKRGILLVEAKSYPGEMRGSGCKAKPKADGGAIETIEETLKNARNFFGAGAGAGNWIKQGYYQYANRLAHLWFLLGEPKEELKVDPTIDAWLINLYFLNDESMHPTTRDEWNTKLGKFKKELGITKNPQRIVDVFLQAKNE